MELAHRGLSVHLTTSDPAANLTDTLAGTLANLTVSRIEPHAETERYRQHVLATKGAQLDAAGRALLQEDLRSPCTEEIAVFQAFSRVIREAGSKFVVMDTAPTGHTLLLLDATRAYHREVARQMGSTSATNSVNSSGKKASLIRRRPRLSHLTRGQSAERHQLAVLRVPQRQPRAFQAPKQGQPWRGLKRRIVDMAFAQPVVGDFA